jgi:putative oxidoreductase
MNGNRLFIVGAVMNFLIAALHVAIIFVGAEGYRYFGAGEEMAQMDEAGSWRPAVITAVITLFFFLFGFYGLSGAKAIKKLPLLKPTLVLISVIFLLRGAAILGDAYMMVTDPTYPSRMMIFSLVALVPGLCYAIGTKKTWSSL